LTSEPRRLLVVAPNWLGDAVMALPAIADIRRHFADARLIIAARPSVAALFEMVPGVEQVVAFPASGDPAIAILLPNSFNSAWRVWRAGVPERWGYGRDFRSRLLTRAVRVPRASMHQGRYYQHLVAELGIPTGSLQPEVQVPVAALDQARQLVMSAGWDGTQPLVVIAAGAAYGTAKRWLPRHFSQLIDDLARTEGARSVLVGSAADAETMRMILTSRAAADPAPIDLTGRTTLPALAGVLALARACVSNDSGAMHLAGAIGTPLVALFGPTRETETAPLTRAGGRAEVLANPVWCRPCMLRECPIDHRCMRGLEPARVLAGVRSVLA
jgi:heptosyltransferase-2